MKRLLFLLLFPVLLAAQTYQTNFPATENPISQGGKWLNGSTNGGGKWGNVQTTPGFVFGTIESAGCGGTPTLCNDNTAILSSAWAGSQVALATVRIANSSGLTSGNHEVELRLRSTINASGGGTNSGYEINCSVNPTHAYVQIVRWNGALGSFTLLDARTPTAACASGDVLMATAVGSTISAYKSVGSGPLTFLFSVTDSTFSGGSPGVGFFDDNDTNLSFFGFSSFLATGGPVAATCGSTDTQTAITAATQGQTVFVPPGTCSWTSGVTVSGKGIGLQGAGGGRIIAVDAEPTTAVTIGNGSKTFSAVKSDLGAGAYLANTPAPITVGQTLRIIENGWLANFMQGTVTSYNSSTGALVMNITSSGGTCGTTQANGMSSNCKRWLISTTPLTVITDNRTSASGAMIGITENPTFNTAVSGIEFAQGSGNCSTSCSTIFITRNNSGGQAVLIHDNFFQSSNFGDIIDGTSSRGVIWNNSFLFSPFSLGQWAIVRVKDFNNTTMPTSWGTGTVVNCTTTPGYPCSTMGTLDTTGILNMYIETNDLHAASAATDFDDNSRVVFRYNVMDNAGVSSHGADTSFIGQRQMEAYNNAGIWESYSDGTTANMGTGWMFQRGGSSVYHDNNLPLISGPDWGTKLDVSLTQENIQRSGGPLGCWGAGGTPGQYYHAPRQTGMGYVTGTSTANYPPDGVNNSSTTSFPSGYSGSVYVGDSDPVYIWNNNRTYTVGIVNGANSCTSPDTATNYIVSGRDFFNGTAKPGYTPFAYPHPLAGGAAAPPTITIPPTFFGMHTGFGTTPYSTPILAPIVAGALGKPVGTHWPYMETSRGVYNFNNMTNAMNFALGNGIPVFYSYQQEPQWAVTDTSGCVTASDGTVQCPSAPSDLTVSAACQAPLLGTTTTDCQLKEFTTTLVQRYKSTGIQTGCTSGNPQCNGVIQMYEGWNEPASLGTGGVLTNAQLVTVSQDFLNTIRANDPSAQVCSPAFSFGTSPTYTTIINNFFSAGGPTTYDCYDFHINETTPEAQIADISAFKTLLTNNGVPANPTIYATEAGRWGDCATAISGMTQQAYIGRIELLYASNNVKRHYWYAYGSCVPLTNQPTTQTLNAAGIGYGTVESWMSGATLSTPCAANGTVWTCGLSQPNGNQTLAVWNTAGNSTFSAPGQYTQYQDLEGGFHTISGGSVPIGTEPVLLATIATAATPTFTPLAGSYYSPQTVTISTTTPSATINFTTNGTTPTTASPVYTTPFVVNATNANVTVKAIATPSGGASSAVGSAVYGIYQEHQNYPNMRTSQFTYGGTWDGNQQWIAQHLDVINSGQYDVSAFYSLPPTSSSPGTYDTNYTDTTIASWGYYNWVIEAAASATPYWNNPEGVFIHHTQYDYKGYGPPHSTAPPGGFGPFASMFDFVEKINGYTGDVTADPGIANSKNAAVNGAFNFNTGTNTYTDISTCLFYGVGQLPSKISSGFSASCTAAALTITTGNYLYLGYFAPFDTINVTMTTPSAGTVTYQYCSVPTTVNGTCQTWSNLTVTDGTAGFHTSGAITFLPPALWQRNIITGTGVTTTCGTTTNPVCTPGWPPNTTRPKFWVRALVTGGSAGLGTVRGDDWTSNASDAATVAACGAVAAWVATTTYGIGAVVSFSGSFYVSLATSNVGNQPDVSPDFWDPQPSGACNMRSWCGVGTTGYTISSENFKYNPSPGNKCTATFEYQARMNLNSGLDGGQWLPNSQYPDSVSGRMLYPDYAEKKLANNLLYYHYVFPPVGVMWDDIAAYPPGLTPAETLSTTHMNDTDLYPCGPAANCIPYTQQSNPVSAAWSGAYRPAQGASGGPGLYQIIASIQGVNTPGYLQTCNGGTISTSWTACDVAWKEQIGVNYQTIEDLMQPTFDYYTIYDTVRDSPNPNNTLVGWYYPTIYNTGKTPSAGPVTSGSLFQPFWMEDMSNRHPMFVLAQHYIMQPGTQTNGGTTAMIEPALGNGIYAFMDAYGKLGNSTTTTVAVPATQNPPVSGVYDPVFSFTVADATQLGASSTFINSPSPGRDIPLGCYEQGTSFCNRIIRICQPGTAGANTCDQPGNGELLMVNVNIATNTLTVKGGNYHNYAIINSYPSGSTVQNFVHGSLSADMVAGCGQLSNTCSAVSWHNVLYWDGMFPAEFFNIGVPDTVNGWCGVGAGSTCPTPGTTNTVASCHKTLSQYPNGCSPGDRDMLFRTGTAASGQATCSTTVNFQHCAPVWRRDYVNSSGTQSVVLWRIDSGNDWPTEQITLGQPIDLQNAAEKFTGPYQELFADGTLSTPLHSCIKGTNCSGPVTTMTAYAAIPNGHQIIQLYGTESAILVSQSQSGTVSLTSPLAFGNQSVNTTSGALLATLANNTTAPLIVSNVVLNPTNFARSGGSCIGTSFTLAAGQTCTFGVTFTPTAATSYSGTLSVTDNVPTSPQISVLTGQGTTPAVTATLTPNPLAFASQNLNTTSAGQSATLTNTGPSPVIVTQAQVFGTNFSLTNLGSCFTTFGSNTSFTLPVGQFCTYTITTTPTVLGPYTATFQVTSNAAGSPQVITLSGTGTAPIITWSSPQGGTTYNFGNVTVGSFALSPSGSTCTTTPSSCLELTNTGTGPLAVALSIAGANIPQFSPLFSTNCPGTLAAGASCTAVVQFTPSAATGYTAFLRETDSVQSLTGNVTLNGTGMAAPPPGIVAPVPTMIIQ